MADLLKRKTGPKPMSVDVRFWRHVCIGGNDECWEWTGSKLPKGYGQFGINRSRPVLAHRMAWTLANGPVPDNLHVLHRCDNPNHLFLGTNAENIADRVVKGRSAKGEGHWTARNPDRVRKGERSGNSKLTGEAVAQIKMLRASGATQQELADRFGVSRATIYLIQEGKRWTCLANQS